MNEYNLIILENQGFCFGVTNAINNVFLKLATLQKPVYLLGDLVHNKYVTKKLIDAGINVLTDDTRFEMLDQIESGSVIISAHGVSNDVYDKIKFKNLFYFDTTCPFVLKSHKIINHYLEQGYDVIYIGKLGHPEVEAICSLKNVHIVENESDIEKLNINNKLLVVTNQTTLSVLDLENLHFLLKKKYPYIEIANSVCNATKSRQLELINAIESLKGKEGLVIVIGDPKSNNTSSLAKRALNFKNISVLKIENKNDVCNNLSFIKSFHDIIIASGASTPQEIIDEVIFELKKTLKI